MSASSYGWEFLDCQLAGRVLVTRMGRENAMVLLEDFHVKEIRHQELCSFKIPKILGAPIPT